MPFFKEFVALAFFCAVAAHPQAVRSQARVTEEDVMHAMEVGGYSVTGPQVTMLSTIPTTVEHPALQLMKIEPMGKEKSRVLLRCADKGACIPFYVMVAGISPQERAATRSSGGDISKHDIASPVVMKQGETATLELASHEMLITLKVVCLQSGQAGQRIKVVSTDRKMTYFAEVVRKGLLRSSL